MTYWPNGRPRDASRKEHIGSAWVLSSGVWTAVGAGGGAPFSWDSSANINIATLNGGSWSQRATLTAMEVSYTPAP